jgi:predicted ATPase
MVPERECAHLLAVQVFGRCGQTEEAATQMQILRRAVSEQCGGRLSAKAERVASGLNEPFCLDGSASATGVRFPSVAFPDPIFGREDQIRFILDCLDPVEGEKRLVTTLGMGGIGKTHLLRCACRRLRDAYRGQVAFIDLADVDDANVVPSVILRALSLRCPPTDDPIARLARSLGGAPVLLALDNLEQFNEAIGPLVRRLMVEIPNLRILAGSRIPLNVQDECRLNLTPLTLPEESAGGGEAKESPAMQLFLNAIEADRMGATVRNEDLPIVSNIVRRLEGVPLGMQLAASRLRTLGPAALLQDLDEGLSRLVNRRGDVPERHRSIRNALTGSFDQLRPSLRGELASLAVFRGGWTLEAAKEVCGIIDPAETMDQLVDAALIYVSTDGPPIRYRMLETIRELQQRLVNWLVDRSQSVAEELVNDAIRAEFDRVEPETDNLREALRYALDHDPESAFILGGNFASYWILRTSGYEPQRFYADLFNRHGGHSFSPSVLRASYGHALNVHFHQTRNSTHVFERTLNIGREIGDLSCEIKVRVIQANYLLGRARFLDVQAELGEIDRFIEAHGSFSSDGFVRRLKGICLYFQGDLEASIEHLKAAVEWFSARGEFNYQTRTRMMLAYAAIDLGDLELAERTFAGVFERAREVRLGTLIPGIGCVLGRIAMAMGRHEEAEFEFKRSHRAWQEMGSPFQEAELLNSLGRNYLYQGRLHEAKQCFGEAAALWSAGDFSFNASVALFGMAKVQFLSGEAVRAARLLAVAKREFQSARTMQIRFHTAFAEGLETDLLGVLGMDSLDPSNLTLSEAIRLGQLS